MIRLKKVRSPLELTKDLVDSLTQQYISASQKPEWAPRAVKKLLKRQLGKMGRTKCAYCEVKLDRNSEWFGIDHFKCKSRYPSLVLNWKNLLPCCQRCNMEKGDLDIAEFPLPNPRFHKPSTSLRLEMIVYDHGIVPQFQALDTRGQNLIVNLLLNDDRVLIPRGALITGINHQIELMLLLIEKARKTTMEPNEESAIKRQVAGILHQAMPKQQYCATVSSFLFASHNFGKIHEYLLECGLWSSDLERRYSIARKHVLACKFLDLRTIAQ